MRTLVDMELFYWLVEHIPTKGIKDSRQEDNFCSNKQAGSKRIHQAQKTEVNR